VEPKWEDPRCEHGGKWTVMVPKSNKQLLDTMWLHGVLGCIGEQFDDGEEVCGMVVNVRPKQDRISVWTKTAANEALQVRGAGQACLGGDRGCWRARVAGCGRWGGLGGWVGASRQAAGDGTQHSGTKRLRSWLPAACPLSSALTLPPALLFPHPLPCPLCRRTWGGS
jgi:hypothetical protein